MDVFSAENKAVWIEYSSKEMAAAKVAVDEIFDSWQSKLAKASSPRPLFGEFSRSLFMFAVYQASRSPDGVVSVTAQSLRKGLAELQALLDANGLELYDAWLEKSEKTVLKDLSPKSKVFESYLLGELCDELHLDETDALAVLDEMKKLGKVCRVGTKFGTPLMARV